VCEVKREMKNKIKTDKMDSFKEIEQIETTKEAQSNETEPTMNQVEITFFGIIHWLAVKYEYS